MASPQKHDHGEGPAAPVHLPLAPWVVLEPPIDISLVNAHHPQGHVLDHSALPLAGGLINSSFLATRSSRPGTEVQPVAAQMPCFPTRHGTGHQTRPLGMALGIQIVGPAIDIGVPVDWPAVRRRSSLPLRDFRTPPDPMPTTVEASRCVKIAVSLQLLTRITDPTQPSFDKLHIEQELVYRRQCNPYGRIKGRYSDAATQTYNADQTMTSNTGPATAFVKPATSPKSHSAIRGLVRAIRKLWPRKVTGDAPGAGTDTENQLRRRSTTGAHRIDDRGRTDDAGQQGGSTRSSESLEGPVYELYQGPTAPLQHVLFRNRLEAHLLQQQAALEQRSQELTALQRHNNELRQQAQCHAGTVQHLMLRDEEMQAVIVTHAETIAACEAMLMEQFAAVDDALASTASAETTFAEGGAEPINSAELGPFAERLQQYIASRALERRVTHQMVHDLIEENRRLKVQLQ